MYKVHWRKYEDFSGCFIAGTTPVPLPKTNLHLDRAYYLTSLIEAPTYGAVQSYDGVGMSGGPLHHIAVYLANKQQGSLFELLRAIEYGATGSHALAALWDAYKQRGWFVARDGSLRDIKTGSKVLGPAIIEEFTPPKGVVPNKGPLWEQAARWALLHHAVFADPKTHHIQQEFAIDYLLKTQRAVETIFYKDFDVIALRVSHDVDGVNTLSPAEDLALCVYHAHSVNSPAPAAAVLSAVLKQKLQGVDFAHALIRGLAEKKFGNWKLRYVRTRSAAMQSNLWPKALFLGANSVMPAISTQELA